MTAIARLFGEWWADRYPENQPDGTEFDKDDLGEAFGAGWEACYHARWEPVGGLPFWDLKPGQEAGPARTGQERRP